MENVESRLRAIEERNRRVEADKAWEVSGTRRVGIACFTYATATLFLLAIDDASALLHGLIPTGGYALSTLSLPGLKRRWMRMRGEPRP